MTYTAEYIPPLEKWEGTNQPPDLEFREYWANYIYGLSKLNEYQIKSIMSDRVNVLMNIKEAAVLHKYDLDQKGWSYRTLGNHWHLWNDKNVDIIWSYNDFK